ncbi:hypothetical protein GUITHDRAFT_121613 [Guillardia theta CCMP2712]|uniref:Uncharacterized protein n=1 Tax=Guillardia theta (strain CCMP2712) TaxID=905079 RepID=L1I8Q3_GUITC|nr:hypothetical protein GUITHDRAFT_121613 [Guillardia theta CCMP2712]EKX32225.1 hypothetical protein GUITHDRAFT_121613 [Guillardia theta CCMP2712]|eukprot:XP_005819205.1 hypothetical protein GUITHDRAFT_121613 [Guillardia theta CCMP2712]
MPYAEGSCCGKPSRQWQQRAVRAVMTEESRLGTLVLILCDSALTALYLDGAWNSLPRARAFWDDARLAEPAAGKPCIARLAQLKFRNLRCARRMPSLSRFGLLWYGET